MVTSLQRIVQFPCLIKIYAVLNMTLFPTGDF